MALCRRRLNPFSDLQHPRKERRLTETRYEDMLVHLHEQLLRVCIEKPPPGEDEAGGADAQDLEYSFESREAESKQCHDAALVGCYCSSTDMLQP